MIHLSFALVSHNLLYQYFSPIFGGIFSNFYGLFSCSTMYWILGLKQSNKNMPPFFEMILTTRNALNKSSF